MIGFLPGFAYLGAVDDRIAAPRRATPRLKVPAGSVGIAGRQTGVYPLESPGGWQIVGRTPIGMFDPRRQPPVRMQAGDRVRFVSIDPGEFARAASRGVPVSAVQIVRPSIPRRFRSRWAPALGRAVSGPMDAWSARLANRLVGNADATALLEVTLRPGVQPRGRVDRRHRRALTSRSAAGHGARPVAVYARPWCGRKPAGRHARYAFDGGVGTPDA
jgi:hypothetical protein